MATGVTMDIVTGVVDGYLSLRKYCPGPYLSNDPSDNVVGQNFKNAIFTIWVCKWAWSIRFFKVLENVVLVHTFPTSPHTML